MKQDDHSLITEDVIRWVRENLGVTKVFLEMGDNTPEQEAYLREEIAKISAWLRKVQR